MAEGMKYPALGRIYIEKRYPQNPLISAWEFERYCRDRGMAVDKDRLESLDRDGRVRPALWIKRVRIPYKRIVKQEGGVQQEHLVPLKEGEDPAAATDYEYAPVSNDQFFLQGMADQGLLEFPEEAPFRPWSEYRDANRKETAFAYYHPLQVLLAKRSEQLGTISFDETIVDASPDEVASRLTKGRERRDISNKMARGQLESIERLIRLLMRVEDAILPDLRHEFVGTLSRKGVDGQLADWLDWRKELDWKALVSASGFTPTEVKDLHTHWSVHAQSLDPMRDWYLLIQNVPYEKRKNLKGDARLAQDYYEVALMLEAIYHAVTGEHLSCPDDVMDVRAGAWKEEWYGTRDVFEDRTARLVLLTEYGLNPVTRVHLILEGVTEAIFVEKLAAFLGLDLEGLGIELHDIEGVGGLKSEHLWHLLWHALKEGSVAYVMVDDDEGAREDTDELIKTSGPGGERLLREEFRTIWNGEFEEDNFGLEEIVEAFLRVARSKGIRARVSAEDLQSYMTSAGGKAKKVTKALKQLAWEKTALDLEGHRKELAGYLAAVAIEKIQQRIAEVGRYEPATKIEKELQKVVDLAYALGHGAKLEKPS
jgi:hypothetical protein